MSGIVDRTRGLGIDDSVCPRSVTMTGHGLNGSKTQRTPKNLTVIYNGCASLFMVHMVTIQTPVGKPEMLELLATYEGKYVDLYLERPKDDLRDTFQSGLHPRIYCIVARTHLHRLILRVQPFDLLECTCGNCV